MRRTLKALYTRMSRVYRDVERQVHTIENVLERVKVEERSGSVCLNSFTPKDNCNRAV